MQTNKIKLICLRNRFSLIKYIFQIFFIILIYQFIEITNNYLSFPNEVEIDLNEGKTIELPSITFCLSRSKRFDDIF